MGLFTVASTGWADSIALTGGLYGNGSWMTNATAWADGQVPHDDADYIVDRNNTDKNNNASCTTPLILARTSPAPFFGRRIRSPIRAPGKCSSSIPEGTMTLDEATRGITIRGTAAEIESRTPIA